MENQQMGMPAEMAAPAPNPEEMAVYDRMRQEISPQEFSNEMLASASQVDPQAVAEFTEELQSLDVSPEELDALNDLVDEVLASPEQYDQLRKKYLSQGMPDDILPEQFDPYFFAALNMAVDQMIAAPTGVQAFAEGGIAELKPIAKAIASYGRNGDTMLAHITPAEARMLRRRGGSGTINPHTGLPEFFLKKAFKSIGNAVKKFASSTVGRLVTTVALGFFLGPAAASVMGVGAGTAAGMAISGFVGGAGSTLLAGGNLKDALKAGAIGGVTAGIAQGLSGAPLTGPATMTPGQALQSRVDQFTNMFKPGAAVQASLPGAGTGPQGIGPNQAAVPPAGGPQFDVGDPGAGFEPMGGGTKPSIFEQGKQLFNEKISPSGIREGATPGAQQAGVKAVTDYKAQMATAGIMPTDAALTNVYNKAFNAAMPGVIGTYGPMAAVGLGTMAAFGGFDTKPVQGGEITNSLMKPVTQRIQEKGTQRQMYMQGLPGVVYDEYGAPVYGQSTRLPTYDVPDYNSGGFGIPGQGIMDLPSVYVSPSGTIGSRSVAQPYNNSDMYSNIMPQRYADGGTVTDLYRTVLRRDPSVAEIDNWKTQFGDTIDERERAVFREAAGNELATQRTSAAELATQQKAARDAAAQQKAMRRAQGSGSMYANINAGLSALAPETNPMDTADTGFGARNRAARTADLQRTYAPMLQGQRFAMDQQAGIAASGQLPSDVSMYSGQDKAGLYRGLARQGMTDAQIRAAAENRYGMQTDADWQGLQRAVADPTLYTQRPGMQQSPITTMPVRPPGGMGNSDPFYQQRMALDAQVNTRNSQGQNATPAQLAEMRRLSELSENSPELNARRDAYNKEVTDRGMFYTQGQSGPSFMNMGGIAGLAQGGYPRRTGQISGPGTEKSDSIPAMLSDGEFVMTAKAVRGAGKGSRRAGAKQMYKLMHQLEKNAERG